MNASGRKDPNAPQCDVSRTFPTLLDKKTHYIFCDLLGYYAASSGDLLPTFRVNLSVSLKESRIQNMGPIDCLETSIRNYHYSLRNDPEGRSSQLLRDRSLKSRKPLSWCWKNNFIRTLIRHCTLVHITCII